MAQIVIYQKNVRESLEQLKTASFVGSDRFVTIRQGGSKDSPQFTFRGRGIYMGGNLGQPLGNFGKQQTDAQIAAGTKRPEPLDASWSASFGGFRFVASPYTVGKEIIEEYRDEAIRTWDGLREAVDMACHMAFDAKNFAEGMRSSILEEAKKSVIKAYAKKQGKTVAAVAREVEALLTTEGSPERAKWYEHAREKFAASFATPFKTWDRDMYPTARDLFDAMDQLTPPSDASTKDVSVMFNPVTFFTRAKAAFKGAWDRKLSPAEIAEGNTAGRFTEPGALDELVAAINGGEIRPRMIPIFAPRMIPGRKAPVLKIMTPKFSLAPKRHPLRAGDEVEFVITLTLSTGGGKLYCHFDLMNIALVCEGESMDPRFPQRKNTSREDEEVATGHFFVGKRSREEGDDESEAKHSRGAEEGDDDGEIQYQEDQL